MNLKRRKSDHSTYSFQTTTGRGPAKVHVGYEMDSDGDVYDIEIVLLDGTDITAALNDDPFDSITDQCFAHYERESKQNNDDMRIAAAESKSPYYYNDRI